MLREFVFVTLQFMRVAAIEQEYFRWDAPYTGGRDLVRRVDGYHPEFGSCGSGKTCTDACGDGWDHCNATTTLSLFCYNPGVGQTCCGNGSGRKCLVSNRSELEERNLSFRESTGACDKGFYCAWAGINGQTWCCEDVSPYLFDRP